ncbi:MAG: peptidoglycan DD-metalloendopeptidase family protein [Phenylobacterium sp.]|uniref:M23 family metallopeptidase n=1 Tax=Phenylobacterium sp. TaxID=1871053 RepID=UPI00391D7BD6
MQEFDPRQPASRNLALTPKLLAGAAGLAVVAFGCKLALANVKTDPPPPDPAVIAALEHEAFSQAEIQPGFTRPENVAVKIQPGETFEAAVRRAGVSSDEARQAVRTLGEAMDTVHIKAGMAFDAAIAHPRGERGPARLIGLSLRTGPATAVTLSRTFDGALRLREMEEEVREEETVAKGQIDGSLYESAARLGATPTVTASVAKMFAHKLDFQRDIQPGDSFTLIFDRKITESGRTIETGEVEYAEVKGVKFYRFERRDGDVEYFDENGKNVRGFLLRTPVDGARMTSRFGMRRHPILGYTRMHQGIDFGAGMGTPVVAAGDGVVVEARRWGGYGNWVRVRHTGGWETGYAHLSRFGKGIRAGQRVKQGQVIAYVGSTGASTGPHLHYEIWKGGKRVNPVGAKVPQGTVLAGAELAAFKAEKARIDRLVGAETGATTLAMADGAKDVTLRR